MALAVVGGYGSVIVLGRCWKETWDDLTSTVDEQVNRLYLVNYILVSVGTFIFVLDTCRKKIPENYEHNGIDNKHWYDYSLFIIDIIVVHCSW